MQICKVSLSDNLQIFVSLCVIAKFLNNMEQRAVSPQQLSFLLKLDLHMFRISASLHSFNYTASVDNLDVLDLILALAIHQNSVYAYRRPRCFRLAYTEYRYMQRLVVSEGVINACAQQLNWFLNAGCCLCVHV